MRQLLSVGKKNWGGHHYHNSGEHWWQSAVDIIMSFILDDPTATTGSKLWLIKGTEPFNCARYSEEHRVIQRHSHSKANLKTCEWKKRHHMWYSLIFCSPFGWDMTFRALTLLLNIASIMQCKRTQRKIYQTTPPPSLHLAVYIQSTTAQSYYTLNYMRAQGFIYLFQTMPCCVEVSQSPLKVLQSSEQHQTHSSQYGSLDKSYAYSNIACVVNAVALHSSGC